MMKSTYIYYVLIISVLSTIFYSCREEKKNWELSSPGNKIQLKVFTTDPENGLAYQVYLAGEKSISVLDSSDLGIIMNNLDFSKNLKFSHAGYKEINESYSTLTGKRINDINHCNELTLEFTNSEYKKLEVIFRAYDDGIAFRYNFPDMDTAVHTIISELSSFNLNSSDGKSWMQTYDTLKHWSLGYEIPYEKEIPIGTSAQVSYGWALPLLFEKPNGIWILISEADLDESYCGMHIKKDAPDGNYSLEFPGEYECYGKFSRFPKSGLPWKTPWRFAIIGDNPGTLVESNMVNHLSRPT
ncbi:MAG: glycoside hydrolase family 97 N-terminal domain-containing protein, partial [Bacteroidales bacterium]|nr:glycoside hydrolase family 97 N-terminal domain-containing protein [Bacteroidales bacterium]